MHLLNTTSEVRILCRGSCGTHIEPPPLPLSAAAVVCGRCFARPPSNKTSLLPTRCQQTISSNQHTTARSEPSRGRQQPQRAVLGCPGRPCPMRHWHCEA